MSLAATRGDAYRRDIMKNRITSTLLGAGAALLAGGVAVAQPPRLIPPVDQYGTPQSAVAPLELTGDTAAAWMLRPQEPTYLLQMEGQLAQSPGVDTIRLEREGQPDAILSVAPDTSFFLDGRSVPVTAIPAGSEIAALFDLQGDVRIARQVQASSPGNPVAAVDTLETVLPFSAEIPGERVTAATPQQLLPDVQRLGDVGGAGAVPVLPDESVEIEAD